MSKVHGLSKSFVLLWGGKYAVVRDKEAGLDAIHRVGVPGATVPFASDLGQAVLDKERQTRAWAVKP